MYISIIGLNTRMGIASNNSSGEKMGKQIALNSIWIQSHLAITG